MAMERSDTTDEGREITIEEDEVRLNALVSRPAHPRGVVIFAHGSGSGRHSPRNQFVARLLNEAGFATVLADLLMEDESGDRNKVFDIDLLADRLGLITNWVAHASSLSSLGLGYFGASTGAAAALQAAAEHAGPIRAVVSRGGRPDLAMEFLEDVEAATLLIVGSLDEGVLELNEQAYARLSSEKQMTIVPGAGHLFEEPGTLEKVAQLAADWFAAHLMESRRTPSPPSEPVRPRA